MRDQGMITNSAAWLEIGMLLMVALAGAILLGWKMWVRYNFTDLPLDHWLGHHDHCQIVFCEDKRKQTEGLPFGATSVQEAYRLADEADEAREFDEALNWDFENDSLLADAKARVDEHKLRQVHPEAHGGEDLDDTDDWLDIISRNPHVTEQLGGLTAREFFDHPCDPGWQPILSPFDQARHNLAQAHLDGLKDEG